MNICLYGASSNDIDRSYVDAVYSLTKSLAKRGHRLIYGGGGQGLMGAAARGMTDGGGKIVGIVPKFLNVDGILYDASKCEEFIFTEDMRSRKKLMEEKSDAFITVPGGIGTYEEFFEILTLKQLGRHKKPMVLFNIGGYYEPFYRMLEATAEGGFMKRECLGLFKMLESEDEIIEYIENGEEDFGGFKFKNI